MKNFGNKFNREKGNDSRERDFRREGHGKRQFGNRDRERPQMHEAICSDCGKKCEVPFKPTGDKPVYCSQCFSKHRGSSISNSSGRRGYGRPRFQDKDRIVNQYKEQFDMLNAKLDRIIKALTPVVPVKEEKKEVIVKKKERVVEKKEKAKKDKKK